MNLDQYWSLIDGARQATGKLVEMPPYLVEALSQLDEREIVDFHSHFEGCLRRAYDANLWLGAVVILGGCGDDKFTDFRCWLIAQGRDAFESALADPDTMAGLERFDGDHGYPILFYLRSVGRKAFCQRVAGNPDDSAAQDRFESLTPVGKRPAIQNPELLNTSDGDSKMLFPKLAARFPNGLRS